MSFLAPLFLLAGLGAAVPLLLHLLRRNIGNRVEFPAARYLQRAEQEHSRSMRIRNLLLMLLRVLLILAIAFAAARPFVSGFGVGHGPTALAVVLDNSMSTTAVVDGKPVFALLQSAARALVSSATPADRVWLVTADGRVRGGAREVVLSEIDRVVPMESGGDLPLALRRASAAVSASTYPSKSVALATDAQATAFRHAARTDVPVAVYSPNGKPPKNAGVLAVAAEPSRWTPRGMVSARIDAPDSAGYRVLIGNRTLARGAVARGEAVHIRVSPPERGWSSVRTELEQDEYAADDHRFAAVWVGAPPAVNADPSAGIFVNTALASLVGDGRATIGRGVSISSADATSALPALITPPGDAVRLGAANRNLARLGIPWRFAAIQNAAASVRGASLDSITVNSRYRLVHEGTQASDTLALAGGEPWLVSGAGYVLIASRIDPSATTLPIRAVFVPWLADMLDFRLGAPAGDVGAPIAAVPGARVHLPSGIDAWENDAGTRRAVSGQDPLAPDERGVWYLLHGPKRVGALVVNAEAEESNLARMNAGELAARIAGPRGRASASSSAWSSDVYSSGSRRPAITPLLILALLLLIAESMTVRSTLNAA